MKKYLYVLFLFVISCFCLLMVDLSVSSASSEVYLIMTNPAEDCNTSMTITWHTLVEGTYVEYTVKEDEDFSESIKVDGIYEELTIYNGSTDSDITDFKCYAVLENLQPDTEYSYRVGKDSLSDVYSFKTGGVEDFNFAVVSDIHVYTKLATRLTKAEDLVNSFDQKGNLSFVLSVGDTMAYGTHRGYWDDLCNSSIIRDQMFAATPGNHDYYNGSATFLDDSYFNAYTKNPDNGPEGMKNTTYYFYYNNIMFISLNSEDACTNDTKKQLQREWLNEVLEKNTANFIVVYFHRSMYPGSGGNTGHAKKMKEAYQDLFDKYGVDLVFGGHDHVYVRTAKILNGTTSDSGLFGTTYVSLPQIGDRVNTSNDDYTDIIKKFGSLSGALFFRASKDTLSFELYNDAMERIDGGLISSKMSLIDQKKFEKDTKITYQEKFSNMSLNIYNGLFQRATNIKVYDGENVVLDFRPEYNKLSYPISNVSDTDLQKNYKLIITYRDGTIYEKEYLVKNEDLEVSFTSNDIICEVDALIDVKISNSLNLDLEYTYQFDEEYIKLVDGKLYAKKAGTTIITASTEGYEDAIEITVTINEKEKEEIKEEEKKINVIYHLDGGKLDNPKDSFKQDEVIILGTPTKEGFVFKGWYLDIDYTNEFISQKYDNDIAVYAKWEEVKQEAGCNSAAILYSSLMLLGLFFIRRKKI